MVVKSTDCVCFFNLSIKASSETTLWSLFQIPYRGAFHPQQKVWAAARSRSVLTQRVGCAVLSACACSVTDKVRICE